MSAPEIRLVSLDGLNNTGKTTQLDYLRSALRDRAIATTVRKGDGARRGRGEVEWDPVSPWWQQHYYELHSAGLEGKAAEAAARKASCQLVHEWTELRNDQYPRQLMAERRDLGVILLDRGPLSRLFVARRFDPAASLEQALGYEAAGELEQVLPDKIVVLHAAKAVLLDRNISRRDGAAKQEFNKQIITRYYDDFARVLDDIPPLLGERTVIVDSSGPALEVGQVVLRHAMEGF